MMKKIIEFSVNHPLLINLLSIFLIVAGGLSLFSLRREAFPNVNYDMVMVQTNYFGAPPEEVEKLITINLEDELKEVDGIDEMVSVSSENVSLIILKLDPDEKEKTKVVNDIQRAIDRVDHLPEDAEDPIVTEMQSKNFPVLSVSLSGDFKEVELQKLARDLEIRILDLPDVARIDRIGWRDREIWVEVNPKNVENYHLSLEDIMIALSGQNRNLPGGTLTTPQGDYLVRTLGEFKTADEIRRVIVRANDLGNWVSVQDIAQVKDAFEDDDLVEKTYGKKAITLTVIKKDKGDILKLTEEIRKTVKKFQVEAPPELHIGYFDDMSYYVKRRLDVLISNGIYGLIFVMACLFFSMNRVLAIMTILGIPVAILATFFVMQMSGVTINLISMFGLIMVLGMDVDDAIIISENIYRHLEEGMSPHEAAIKGASEVALPVISTVLTTIVAFVPLFFMSGIMGKFIQVIPLVVIIALFASLLEALVILPSHLAHFLKRPKITQKKEDRAWFNKMQVKYMDTLRWVIQHRYKALGIFTAVFIGGILLYVTSMRFVLFPQGLIEEFFIRFKAPVGTSLEEMTHRVSKIEDMLLELPGTELDNFVTRIGILREDPSDPNTDRGSNIGQVQVYLTPEKTRGRRKADDIIENLREKMKPLSNLFDQVSFEKVRAGPPVGKPVSIRFRGDDLARLDEVSGKMKEELAKIRHLKDIQDDFDPGKTELTIYIDTQAASKAFLSVREISNTVRNAIDGGIATTIKNTDEEIDVIVRFPKELVNSRAIFEHIYIPNRLGNLVPLNKVATLREVAGLHAIKHFDRKRMINVTANLNEKKITPLEVEKIASHFFQKELMKKYPGITMSFGGEQEETNESLRDFLNALLLAVFLIFIVLATQFNSILKPLIVMMAIPFGITGVIFTFFLHGQPLSFMAMLGVIGLSGVVVNDSIVLVDFIGSLRAEGVSKFESILQAGKIRLRAVFLTSITTVVGVLPLAYGIGGSDPFLKPMALAIGWGVAFSTVLTLLLIPCFYAISDDMKDKIIPQLQARIKPFMDSLRMSMKKAK